MAWHRRKIFEAAGIEIVLKPVSIDVLLNLQAGRSPWDDYVDPLAPPKRKHLLFDIRRMANYWSVPFGPIAFRPRSKRAMCVATAIAAAALEQTVFVNHAMKTLWLEARDIEEDDVFRKLISVSELSAFDTEQEQTALDNLTANSLAAYEGGIFGVPSFRIGDDVYFGADRMDVLVAGLGS